MTLLEVAQPENAESELFLLKSTLYSEVEHKYGTKASEGQKNRTKTAIVEEKKMLRRKKNVAKKKFKQLKREGGSEESLKRQNKEWKHLIRAHNKIRIQELDLKEKLEEIKNNRKFDNNPFKFAKEEVTKGSAPQLEPSCDKVVAESFFVDRYSDHERSEKIDFPHLLDMPTKPIHKLPLDPPPLAEFEKYIHSRRNKSAPGPDGIPFIILKRCHQTKKI